MTKEIDQKHAFYKAIKRLMAPVVRLALRRGISVNDLYYWLKALYVEEAESFTIEGKKQSASRIAVLTGLDRKEVAKLRALNEDGERLLREQSTKTNRALRALYAWKSEDEYIDDQGKPKTIPLYGESKGSFEWLIYNHCGDVSMVAILGELKQANLVSVKDELIQLNNEHYIPRGNDQEQLVLMGQAAYDLLSTVEHNIESPDLPSNLQLTVAYTGLSQEALDAFKQLSNEKSIELLKELDEWLRNATTQQHDMNEHEYRAGLGVYFFAQEQNDE